MKHYVNAHVADYKRTAGHSKPSFLVWDWTKETLPKRCLVPKGLYWG